MRFAGWQGMIAADHRGGSGAAAPAPLPRQGGSVFAPLSWKRRISSRRAAALCSSVLSQQHHKGCVNYDLPLFRGRRNGPGGPRGWCCSQPAVTLQFGTAGPFQGHNGLTRLLCARIHLLLLSTANPHSESSQGFGVYLMQQIAFQTEVDGDPASLLTKASEKLCLARKTAAKLSFPKQERTCW